LFIDSGIHWWEECITGKLSHDFRDVQLVTRGGAHGFLWDGEILKLVAMATITNLRFDEVYIQDIL